MSRSTFSMRKRAIAIMLLPALFILASCKSENTVEVTSGGGLVFTMDMIDEEGTLAMLGMSCKDLESAMGTSVGDLGDDAKMSVDDIKDGCRVKAEAANAVDGKTLTDDGDTYTLKLDSSDVGDISEDDLGQFGSFDFSFSVKMPGDIKNATDGGTISGDTVTYTDLKVLEKGIEVTGNKTGGSGSSSNSGSSSSSALVWILIGLGAVLVIGGVFFLISRKSGNKNAGPAYPGAPTPGQNPYSAPQAPYGGGQQFAPQNSNAPYQPSSAPVPPPADSYGAPQYQQSQSNPVPPFGQPEQPPFGAPAPAQPPFDVPAPAAQPPFDAPAPAPQTDPFAAPAPDVSPLPESPSDPDSSADNDSPKPQDIA